MHVHGPVTHTLASSPPLPELPLLLPPVDFGIHFWLAVWLVVRTLVFGWQTFPDLCLIYSQQVITWVKCPIGQPTRPGQANSTFHPSGVSK